MRRSKFSRPRVTHWIGAISRCWSAFSRSRSIFPEWRKLLGVGTTVAAGSLAFFGVAYALRVAELHDIMMLVQRRLRR